jgi:hypothetical protein
MNCVTAPSPPEGTEKVCVPQGPRRTSHTNIQSRRMPAMGFFLLFMAVISVMSASEVDTRNAVDGARHGGRTILTVLYSGPLIRDQDWTIKAGPPGPENQRSIEFGGTCSVIPNDVRNASGFERVTFEAVEQDLGLWKMTWTDTVRGRTADSDTYTYQQQFTYLGTTTDGKVPTPKTTPPRPGVDNDGYYQMVPDNVLADVLEANDIFMVQKHDGTLVANSHVRVTWRLQRSPASQDPPPSTFPVVLLGKYILQNYQQLSGQAGCDPL